MLTTLFYAIAIAPIIYNLHFISDVKKAHARSKRANDLHDQFKGSRYEDWSSEYKSHVYRAIYLILVLVWQFIGLFTSQWFVFLILIGVLLIGSQILKWLASFRWMR